MNEGQIQIFCVCVKPSLCFICIGLRKFRNKSRGIHASPQKYPADGTIKLYIQDGWGPRQECVWDITVADVDLELDVG